MDKLNQLKTIDLVAARITRSARATNRLRKRIGRQIAETQYLLKVSVVALSLAAAGLTPMPVFAAQATTSFNVTATVLKFCVVSSGGNLAFPNYTPTQGAQTANTTLTIRCTKNTAFQTGLDGGSNGGSAAGLRNMLDTGGSGDTLQYGLYTDAALTTNWGNTTGSDTNTLGSPGTGLLNPITQTVYGQIPDNAANQGVTPSSYQDTVHVTVTY